VSAFEAAFAALMNNEGGYSNNPADPGGETMWGITAAVARRHGYTSAMRDLPQATAAVIAHAEYWVPAGCDKLGTRLAGQVFDGAYNSGVGQSVRWLQQAADSVVDGAFGPKTAQACNALGEDTLIARYNAYRLRFLTQLSTWPTFGRGWANRIATNLLRASA
jgi:lysozyme family protein